MPAPHAGQSSEGARRIRTADLLGAIYAAGYSLFARIPHEERVCAARDSAPTEPDMRGYSANVGVFRQKRRLLPDGAPLGLNPSSHFQVQAISGFWAASSRHDDPPHSPTRAKAAGRKVGESNRMPKRPHIQLSPCRSIPPHSYPHHPLGGIVLGRSHPCVH